MKKTAAEGDPTELTDEQYERLTELFKQLSLNPKTRSCPACGGRGWSVLKSASVLVGLQLPDRARNERGYPLVGRSCSNCGYLALHIAYVALGTTQTDD